MSSGESTIPRTPYAFGQKSSHDHPPSDRVVPSMLEKHEHELYGAPGVSGLRTEVALLRQHTDNGFVTLHGHYSILATKIDTLTDKLDAALQDREEKRWYRRHQFLLQCIGVGLLIGIFGLFMARIVFKVI